jgi:hypothetical protein
VRRPYHPLALRRRVVVNLISGPALNGVLLENRGELLVLGDATVSVSGSQPMPAQGQVIVERSNVAFVQVV